ncbi:zinc-binding dehydrogenase [Kitasatospora sp. NPDC088783]|uniref:zinc-binding dehydrogenase n=1 Tax=Kitasatospora sp. NPDC088783 TaxID=3364077 RepID=UPI00382E934F
MRTTTLHGAGDVRVEDVPGPVIENPTDAVVRVPRAAVCGSGLHPYRSAPATGQGPRMGHEFLGTVKVPAALDEALPPSPPALTDVFCTGRHAAVTARVRPGSSVAVVGDGAGDGAVGLCAVLAARRPGAEQVVPMGRHRERTDLGAECGATDVVPAVGDEAAEQVRQLTAGRGVGAVLECVGSMQTLATSFAVVRDGGTVSRVGVPSCGDGPIGTETPMRNITL